MKLTDLVKVGQIIGDTDAFIGAPIHSSVSGKVTKIDEIIGTDGNPIKAVEITTDKLQENDESIKAQGGHRPSELCCGDPRFRGWWAWAVPASRLMSS